MQDAQELSRTTAHTDVGMRGLSVRGRGKISFTPPTATGWQGELSFSISEF